VVFAPLEAAGQPLAERLASLQPQGYLVNDPGWRPPYLSHELIDAAAKLELVTYMGATFEAADYAPFFDLDALEDRGIVFTTTTGTTVSVAEGTLSLLSALNLRLVPANAARKSSAEFAVSTRRTLHGSVLGIVGMGQIGSRVARLAFALGMRIVYYSRRRHVEIEDDLGALFLPLDELFETANHVTIHSSFSLTRGLVGREELRRAHAVTLINTAFPPIVEAEALIEALEAGWVQRAAIEGEYGPPYDDVLRSFDDERVLMLPFMSWNTAQCHAHAWEAYLESLVALREGRSVPHRVLLRRAAV
jgi:phosphoglycerate dehydrogenase-like enzyme